jgi:hypothetical protein
LNKAHDDRMIEKSIDSRIMMMTIHRNIPTSSLDN